MSLLLRHRLPLLLAFFLAASSHGAPSGGDDSYDPSMCLQTHRCGNVTISYPFYLDNETTALLDPSSLYCGYPGFGIYCKDDNHAVLPLEDGNYSVRNINYTDYTISLVDQEVFEYESCPIVDRNVTFPDVSWLSYTDNTVGYILFFFNCDFGPGSKWSIDIRPVNCGSLGGQPPGQFFVLPGNQVSPDSEKLFQECRSVIKVPVLDLPNGPWNEAQWINGGYNKTLRSGFQLEWDRGKPPPCIQCEESHGKCGYTQAGEFIGCLCSDGRVKPRNCGKPFEA